MIHRQNWLDVREYLHHLKARLGRDPQTIHKYWGQLRHLLEWADDVPLHFAHRIEPVLPVYLKSARNDGKAIPLTYTTIYKTLVTVRAFMQYAQLAWSRRYRPLPPSWVLTLHPHSKPIVQLHDHQYYSLEEMQRMAAVATETLHAARAQAGACLAFLSGIRPDALASIPLQCVDLANRRLLQLPQLGIRTKNDKSGITYLLDIPELMNVVEAWDQRVRHAFTTPAALWYAPLQRDGLRLKETNRAIVGRTSMLGEDLQLICKQADVEYKSFHKLRHGHIVHARSLARTMDDVKAISQNVLHSSVVITDQVYSDLKTSQVQNAILNLGSSPDMDKDEIRRLIELLKGQLR